MKVLGSLLKAYIFWLIYVHVNLYSLCYFVISIESLISGENKYLCSEGDAGRNEVRLLRHIINSFIYPSVNNKHLWNDNSLAKEI